MTETDKELYPERCCGNCRHYVYKSNYHGRCNHKQGILTYTELCAYYEPRQSEQCHTCKWYDHVGITELGTGYGICKELEDLRAADAEACPLHQHTYGINKSKR